MVKRREAVTLTKHFIEEVTSKLWAKFPDLEEYPKDRVLSLLVKQMNGKIKPFVYTEDTKEQQIQSASIEIFDDKTFQIQLPPSTSPFKDTFTIAHELGHLFLHTTFDNSYISTQDNSVVFHENGDDVIQEWQANVFAAFFLMPRNNFNEIRNKYQNNLRRIAGHLELFPNVVQFRIDID